MQLEFYISPRFTCIGYHYRIRFRRFSLRCKAQMQVSKFIQVITTTLLIALSFIDSPDISTAITAF